MNFEKHFGSHYAKIGQYIENAKKAANMEQSVHEGGGETVISEGSIPLAELEV